MNSASAVIAAALILLGMYEGWAAFTGGTTISAWVWNIDLAPYGHILALLVGVLMGHFFAVDVASLMVFFLGMVGGWVAWSRVP